MNHRSRGVALPETALVLVLILALLVGAMRVSLLGYEQASVDGAAFYHAHQTAIKNGDPSDSTNLNPDVATHTAFPRSMSQTLAAVTKDAPGDPSVPNAMYGFDQNNNRHGGASLIQPMHTISTVQRKGLASLMLFNGGSVMVSGVGVDPSFRETGVHGDIGGNGFGTAGSFAGAADYFTQGENTPPYFGGFHYMRFCGQPNDAANPWNACPGGPEFLALGLGEYLDADNWGRSPTGVAPAQSAVFWEAAYHQQTYAAISATLYAIPDISTAAGKAAAQALLDHTKSPPLCTVYAWDSTQQGGFPDPNYSPGQYPLTPGAASTCGP